jgi:hypothetical protein
MTTLRDAAQEFVADYESGGCGHFAAYAERFRKLLAQQEQEPAIYPAEAREMGLEEVAFYTHPPRREWQRLTNEEMYGLYRRAGLEAYYPRDGVVQGDYDRRIDVYARAIEAALKEKNA